MNERINELFDLALDVAVPETWTNLNPAQVTKLKEKFAELIVDECCLKLWSMHERVKGNHNYYGHAALELKRHFGVEE